MIDDVLKNSSHQNARTKPYRRWTMRTNCMFLFLRVSCCFLFSQVFLVWKEDRVATRNVEVVFDNVVRESGICRASTSGKDIKANGDVHYNFDVKNNKVQKEIAFTTKATTSKNSIDRIYYFNSFANPQRYQFMEKWLSNQTTPYQRVEPLSGNQSSCGTSLCRYSQRIHMSYPRLAQDKGRSPLLRKKLVLNTTNLNTTVLVIHDDDVFVNLGRLQEFVANFPDQDWTVLHLDCKEPTRNSPWYQQSNENNITNYIRSDAILWRGQSYSLASGPRDLNRDMAQHHAYCVNLGFTRRYPFLEEPQATVVASALIPHPYVVSKEEMRKMMASRTDYMQEANRDLHIDRIYYHNLEKNALRRQNMEFWLQNQPIPYQRINATVGDPKGCVRDHNTPNRCRGISGIVKTLTGIIDNENTTGVSLVLEDDMFPLDKDLSRLEEAIKYVPNDWDLIRFDCWDGMLHSAGWLNLFTIDVNKLRKKTCKKDLENCKAFCGGAFAMLWRGTSVEKLKTMWSAKPIDDADCRIGRTPSVQSYCLNIGIWDHYFISKEISDVSQLED